MKSLLDFPAYDDIHLITIITNTILINNDVILVYVLQ